MSNMTENYVVQTQLAESCLGKVFSSIGSQSKGVYLLRLIPKVCLSHFPDVQRLILWERNVLDNLPTQASVLKIRKCIYNDKFCMLLHDFMGEGSLKKLIDQQGPLSESNIIQHLRSIATIFKALNARGLHVYGFKASKILFTNQGTYLSGLGHWKTPVLRYGLSPRQYHHAPPEVLRNLPPTSKSNIWSIGLVALHMLAGRPVTEGIPIDEIANVGISYRITQLLAKVSPIFRDFILRLTKLNPDERLDWNDLYTFLLPETSIQTNPALTKNPTHLSISEKSQTTQTSLRQKQIGPKDQQTQKRIDRLNLIKMSRSDQFSAKQPIQKANIPLESLRGNQNVLMAATFPIQQIVESHKNALKITKIAVWCLNFSSLDLAGPIGCWLLVNAIRSLGEIEEIIPLKQIQLRRIVASSLKQIRRTLQEAASIAEIDEQSKKSKPPLALISLLISPIVPNKSLAHQDNFFKELTFHEGNNNIVCSPRVTKVHESLIFTRNTSTVDLASTSLKQGTHYGDFSSLKTIETSKVDKKGSTAAPMQDIFFAYSLFTFAHDGNLPAWDGIMDCL